MPENCVNCRFWCPPPEGAPNPMGQCRRYPPTPVMVLSQAPGQISRLAPQGAPQAVQVVPQFPSAWPPSPADGFCGEWVEVKNT